MTGLEIGCGLLAIGALTGLRTMTPIAVICWMTVLGRLPAAQGWTGFVGNRISVAVFSLAGLGELVGDKLPMTPSRTRFPGLAARIVFGGLCAAILASTAGFSVTGGAAIGVLGALVGTFGGWFARTVSVATLRTPDFPVALVEDAVAVVGSILVCRLFHP